MKQAETSVWKRALLVLSPHNYRLFRNQRYKGPIVRNGQITDAYADCGLIDGASDLIGWRSVIVTPDMVGKPIAIFAALETKTATGKPLSTEQKNFIARVIEAGGIAGGIRGEDEIVRFIPYPNNP